MVIEGRNLDIRFGEDLAEDLYARGLLRHRVTWVREMAADEARRLPESALTVERITIRKLGRGEEE